MNYLYIEPFQTLKSTETLNSRSKSNKNRKFFQFTSTNPNSKEVPFSQSMNRLPAQCKDSTNEYFTEKERNSMA